MNNILLINRETLTSLADKIRNLSISTNSLTIEEILSFLDQEKTNIDSIKHILEEKGFIVPENLTNTTLPNFLKDNIILPHNLDLKKGVLYAPATTASYSPISITGSKIDFTYFGGSGTEQLMFPITGLIKGKTYQIKFSETYNGSFIAGSYTYGCGFLQKTTFEENTWPITSGTFVNDLCSWTTTTPGKQEGTITFIPNDSTGYWLWSLSLIKDSELHEMSFSAQLSLVQ